MQLTRQITLLTSLLWLLAPSAVLSTASRRHRQRGDDGYSKGGGGRRRDRQGGARRGPSFAEISKQAFYSLKEETAAPPVIGLLDNLPKPVQHPPSVDDKLLMNTMGESFDKDFSALRVPAEHVLHPQGVVVYPFRTNRKGLPRGSLGDVPPAIRQITADSKLSTRAQRRFSKLLWKQTTCAVRYRWQKTQKQFWPRWIKTGECYSGGGSASCSVPRGMTCQVAEQRQVAILWWNCDHQRTFHLGRDLGRDLGTQPSLSTVCRWTKIHRPVVTGCRCACQEK